QFRAPDFHAPCGQWPTRGGGKGNLCRRKIPDGQKVHVLAGISAQDRPGCGTTHDPGHTTCQIAPGAGGDPFGEPAPAAFYRWAREGIFRERPRHLRPIGRCGCFGGPQILAVPSGFCALENVPDAVGAEAAPYKDEKTTPRSTKNE